MHARSRFIAPAVLLLLLHSSSASAASYGQLGAKLVGGGETSNGLHGAAVAISTDGNTAVVGGYGDNGNLGATWIYLRSGGIWSQQGSKLVGTGAGIGNVFQGISVAVSADGNTAVAGGSADNSFTGAAWVFTRSAGAWSQQGGKLVGSGATGAAHQGASAAMAADGNTLLIGGYGDNSSVGAAWVFTRTAGVWSQQGLKLVGTGAVGASNQGTSVALSADGNTALVGGYNDNAGQGAAWVFTRSAGVWSQQGAKLIGTGAVGVPGQGFSVSLSADGNTAVVGAWEDNGGVGAAWVFTRSGGVWSQQGAKLVGTAGVGLTYQGISAALSADGNTAIVGGYGDNGFVGAAWVFDRSGGVWSQQGGKLTGSAPVGTTYQGISVSVSGDGSLALEGGYGDNANTGAVWTFVNAAPKIVLVHDVPNDQGGVMSVRWNASLLDNVVATPITSYDIWRQVPVHAAQQAMAGGAKLVHDGAAAASVAGRALRATTLAAQTYYWEYVGSEVAHGFPAYSYSVPTLSDSVPGSNPYTLVMVESERPATTEYWSSDPDSGYSVDNLPPGPPAPVTATYVAGATNLQWLPNAEPDFAFYRIYRGGSAGFAPGAGSLIAVKPDIGYVDVGPSGNYYKLSAVDAHGNESTYTLATSGQPLDASAGSAMAFALEQPASPSSGRRLDVSFSLTGDAAATLELFDITGRLVTGRDVGSLGPGRSTVNLAAAGPVLPGVYLVRLSQGGRVRTARVVVLR
jgi:hypothetical protein